MGTLRIVPVAEGEEEGKAEEENISSAGMDEQGRRTEPYHHATHMWDGHEAYIKVGRMATLKEYRGQGVARRLIQEAMEWVKGHSGEVGRGWEGLILSHAQKEVEVWWGKMGFKSDEGLGVWYEEGIEHVGMWRRVDLN